MSGTRMSREELHRLGFRPDGKGALIRLSDAEWQARVDALAHGHEPAVRKPQIRIPKKRIPNRTEQLYQGVAMRRWPDCELRYEAFAFILPSGCRYVPDWSIWQGATLVAVVEVKGGYLHPNSTRSIHAWKEAAAAWPAVRFVFARWKDGTWLETEVPPTL